MVIILHRILILLFLAIIVNATFRLIFYNETPGPFVLGLSLSAAFFFYLNRFLETL
jgi:hypothetical protein